MNLSRSFLVSAGSSLVALALFAVACGGKTVSTDSSTSSQASSAAGKEKDGPKARGTPTGSGAEDCAHSNSGGSSGGGSGSSTCMTFDDYTCSSGGDKRISCECTAENGGPWGKGSCTCDGLTFAFDCTNACSIGAAEYARCGLPLPPADPPSPGSGSSTSSSGGS